MNKYSFGGFYFNSRPNNLQPNNSHKHIHTSHDNNIFDPNMNYYICSFGGCGSTVLFNYLSCFGNVFHIHDRYPPKELKYVGKNNSTSDVYSEWFNDTNIPPDKIEKFKVIYIYRNPIDVIFGRLITQGKPNSPHLRHIMCDENIKLEDVVIKKRDLYKLEEFYDNYTSLNNIKNYNIYCVKYELFFNNIDIFNKILEIPDIKSLYPVKIERKKKKYYIRQLTEIYKSLIVKMNKMPFIKKI